MHDDPALKYLGPSLRFLRQQRGLAQKQLAAKAGVTRAMLSSYENERRVPTLGPLIRLLEAMDFDLCSLAETQVMLRETCDEPMKRRGETSRHRRGAKGEDHETP